MGINVQPLTGLVWLCGFPPAAQGVIHIKPLSGFFIRPYIDDEVSIVHLYMCFDVMKFGIFMYAGERKKIQEYLD